MDNCSTLVAVRHVVTSITLTGSPVFDLQLPPGDVCLIHAAAGWFGVTPKTIRNLLSAHRRSFETPTYRNKARILSQHDMAVLRSFFVIRVKPYSTVPMCPDMSRDDCELKT